MPSETVHTVGSGGNYVSLVAWEAAQQRDLTLATGDDTIAVAEVIGGTNVGNPTGNIDFNGWTTDGTNRIVVRAQAGSEYLSTGVLDTSKAYTDCTLAGGNNGAFLIRHDILIQGIQINLTSGAAAAGAKCVYQFGSTGACTMDGCLIIHTLSSGNTLNHDGSIFEMRANGACDMTNNIMIVNAPGSTGNVVPCFWQGATAATQTMYNNTVVVTGKTTGVCVLLQIRDGDTLLSDNNYLYKDSGTTGNVYNPIVGSSITKGVGDATSTTEATTVGLQSVAYSTGTFTSVTLGAEDLTPVSGSVLVGGGTDLSGFGVTADVRGLARPQDALYDIGAVERAADAPIFIKEVDSTLSLLFESDATLTTLIDPDSLVYVLDEADATIGLKE